jgi:hypothetical protein
MVSQKYSPATACARNRVSCSVPATHHTIASYPPSNTLSHRKIFDSVANLLEQHIFQRLDDLYNPQNVLRPSGEGRRIRIHTTAWWKSLT